MWLPHPGFLFLHRQAVDSRPIDAERVGKLMMVSHLRSPLQSGRDQLRTPRSLLSMLSCEGSQRRQGIGLCRLCQRLAARVIPIEHSQNDGSLQPTQSKSINAHNRYMPWWSKNAIRILPIPPRGI